MSRLLIMIRAYNMLRKHRVTKVQVFTSCSSNLIRVYQTALYGPSYSSAEQDFSPYMVRKEKTPVTLRGTPIANKHNLLHFCHSTYTPHIFTMSDDMDKLPLGVNYYCCKRDSVFQKKEEKCILKMWLPVAPWDACTENRRDSFLKQWLLVTVLKTLTIWFNNQKL